MAISRGRYPRIGRGRPSKRRSRTRTPPHNKGKKWVEFKKRGYFRYPPVNRKELEKKLLDEAEKKIEDVQKIAGDKFPVEGKTAAVEVLDSSVKEVVKEVQEIIETANEKLDKLEDTKKDLEEELAEKIDKNEPIEEIQVKIEHTDDEAAQIHSDLAGDVDQKTDKAFEEFEDTTKTALATVMNNNIPAASAATAIVQEAVMDKLQDLTGVSVEGNLERLSQAALRGVRSYGQRMRQKGRQKTVGNGGYVRGMAGSRLSARSTRSSQKRRKPKSSKKRKNRRNKKVSKTK